MTRKLLRGSPFLRVVDLEGPSPETELPDEIEEMVHLQYLGVRWRLLKKVPSSIGNLGKLQTLDVRGTQVRKLPKSLWMTKTLRHVLGDCLIFPRTTGELKHMQTLETVTINGGTHSHSHSHSQCRPTICRRRKQSGLRFLHRLGIAEMENCKLEDLQTLLMDLCYLEILSLSGNSLPIALLVGAMLSAAGARLRHVASLELDGELLLPHPRNTRDESLFHSCLPGCLSNLTRLVLRRTKINQKFIHAAVAELPILAELEMQGGSYREEEVTFCGSHGFKSLTVLRIAALDTLKRVVMVHSADSGTKEVVHPIFVDMDMVKTAGSNDVSILIRPNNHTPCCPFCKVARSTSVQAYVWQRPSAAGNNGHQDAAPSQGGNKANGRKEKDSGMPLVGDQNYHKMILDTATRLVGLLNGSIETSSKQEISSERVENHHKDLSTGTAAAVTKQPKRLPRAKQQEGASTQNRAGSSLSAQPAKMNTKSKYASEQLSGTAGVLFRAGEREGESS